MPATVPMVEWWNGGMVEFNTPGYIHVQMGVLNSLIQDSTNASVQAQATQLYTNLWDEVARHYHQPSGQLAGPQSRNYGDVFGYVFECYLQDSINQPPLSQTLGGGRDYLPAPSNLMGYFTNALTVSRTEVDVFVKGPEVVTRTDAVHPYQQEGIVPIIGTTYLTPTYSVGSLNLSHIFHEDTSGENKRPLLANFGTTNAQSAWVMDMMLNGTNFSHPLFFSAQNGGDIIAGLTMTRNANDSFNNLPVTSFSGSDLRIRFMLEGTAGATNFTIPASLDSPTTVNLGSFRLTTQLLFQNLDQANVPFLANPYWQVSQSGGNSFLDLVLYNGSMTNFDLSAMRTGLIAFAFRFDDSGSGAIAGLTTNSGTNWFQTQWGNIDLVLPTSVGDIHSVARDFRYLNSSNGMWIGLGTNATWGGISNWQTQRSIGGAFYTNGALAQGMDATFLSPYGSGTLIDMQGTQSVNNIVIANNSDITMSNGALFINGSLTKSNAGTVTMLNNLTMLSTQAWNIQNGTLIAAGQIGDGWTINPTNYSNSYQDYGITKTGNGTLVLSNPTNSFGNGDLAFTNILVSQGTLIARADSGNLDLSGNSNVTKNTVFGRFDGKYDPRVYIDGGSTLKLEAVNGNIIMSSNFAANTRMRFIFLTNGGTVDISTPLTSGVDRRFLIRTDNTGTNLAVFKYGYKMGGTNASDSGWTATSGERSLLIANNPNGTGNLVFDLSGGGTMQVMNPSTNALGSINFGGHTTIRGVAGGVYTTDDTSQTVGA
ncbi:MAG: hypothetical protein SGI98_06480 [Verrucomicrobiota bacterium]|nr:hypothetical protein [Verrucomicrobiota bacterium]